MSSSQTHLAVSRVQMHATYAVQPHRSTLELAVQQHGGGATPPRNPAPADVARVFQQLSLVEKYARVIAHSDHSDTPKIGPRSTWQEQLRRDLLKIDIKGEPGKLGPDPTVSVVSVRMGSPLVAVLEIPPALWIGTAFAFLALAERIATAPVRISRKRKEELLRIAVTDEQIERIHIRADSLSELLLDEGPREASRGPVEIVFTDPGDPDEEIVPATDPPGP